MKGKREDTGICWLVLEFTKVSANSQKREITNSRGSPPSRLLQFVFQVDLRVTNLEIIDSVHL